ncbi:hypothetical protein GII30_06430 [Gordonia amarae]|uniref:Uncharacterized protein n=2 Tax=Gordonia amarae TaxID=36821 RepID=G7GP82_9ACTN|nr:hypothetical protein [Gordonia amarae]MCS3878006.1 vacuolar-type H+-ATPase catalytic subunit A/Vma1 [Gordonia amarae]QHN16707.1 hypothetical protein GII35_06655 [Gordonia amarae]QHN21232.1 hypothetical protein GII34_06435 [Gordonia amarae]QHN30086.1 hypothetical protein GII32_06445 [Gordonia amarae]QHN38859.1 hypothetical protein GII30_06430 [Gordonia amarae]
MRPAISGIVAEHHLAGTTGGDAVAYCGCGWRGPDDAELEQAWGDFAAHFLDKLAEAGYQVVRLFD